MKLFFYFTFHSFVNALKKLFKSWVLIFILVCALIGGLIGFSAAKISDMAESSEDEVEDVIEEPGQSIEEQLGVSSDELTELVAGLVVLGLLVLHVLQADKNGGKIFLPADIPILFASPMQPQSVLLFRLGTQLGTTLVFGLYLLFQVPNMVVNIGMSLSSALSVIAALALTVGVGKLLQVFFYMLCAQSERVKSTLRYWIYGILACIFAVFFFLYKEQGGSWAKAACTMFNGRVSRLIPLWGWLKGFAYYAVSGLWSKALLELLGVCGGMAALIYIIYHIKADFYEDAMAKSEETAETLRRAQGEETSVAMGKRKKDRSEHLRRDDLKRGSGANVFFFKTVYNRFRFAHFGLLTKTLEVYLLAAVAVTLFCVKVLDTQPFYPVVMTLAGLSFYRSLGDSVSTDVKMDFFLLIPESTEKKLFYSLLGNTFDCLLDLLPAMLVTVIAGASPLKALVWMLLIVSVDFYGSTVAAFIDSSTPPNAGKTAKTIVQIMFVYFGLIPDALLLALGVVLEQIPFAAAASAGVNILLGVVFLSLIPRYIDPPAEKTGRKDILFTGDMKSAKSAFSRSGFAVLCFIGGGSFFQILSVTIINRIAPGLLQSSETASWLVTFLPLYLLAFPLALLVLSKTPAENLEKHRLSFSGALTALIISVAMMYFGNLIGTLVTSRLSALVNRETVNPVLTLIGMDSIPLKVLFIVIVAPVIEEYTFRRFLIDRLHIYGQRRAVVVSALLFGLFHGNLSQFFYAFFLGLVFGTVYVKTGRLRGSVLLHMFINLMGSVIAPALLERVDLNAIANLSTENLSSSLNAPLLLYFGYAGFLLLTAVMGLILVLIRRKELHFPAEKYESDRRSALRMTWGNPGMILNLCCCLGFMAYYAFFV